MPSYRHHDFGNLFIQFAVKFPEKGWLEDGAGFEALRQLLPAPALQNVPPTDIMTESADLEDPDNSSGARAFAAAASAAAAGDFEGDEEHPHGERVQCASQ